ncbi:phage tail protein [Pseudomonas sp. Larv2_ips]|uniref:phage tail protein n=1 Tax=Pseudomonas sp. Larv2_ips TaxID=1896942 RepID=UPI000E6C6225|nr:phage tail protein [Pseudomonas sp. Larv2_ips]
MARAAINVLGATGATYDFVTNGAGVIESSRESVGVYHIAGCQGMVPFPPVDEGWGYTVNQVDSRADVDIQFTDGVLVVTVTKDDKPYDLKHMITLHILVPDAPPVEMPQVTQLEEDPVAPES